ncbi:hypothetical protein Nepgr_019101 [Nepenthes gracilis]|uniref:Uncharacterized protein n=1 Tax=Nepenthes gracilis TaxID=150966 RepID=A0AAD3SUL6_NEPGR|nr:hypothetical protein Nepgr_019101 [Nepenthes gracilis]
MLRTYILLMRRHGNDTISGMIFEGLSPCVAFIVSSSPLVSAVCRSRFPILLKDLKMDDNEEREGVEALMPDNVEEEEITSRGNGWEVVSLTASAYAVAPGPKEVESIVEEKGNTADKSEAETSQTLFMSRHFIFPPSQHENLPIGQEDIVTSEKEIGSEHTITEIHEDEGDQSQQKEEENLSTVGLDVLEEFPNVQVFDGKVHRLSIHSPEFDNAATLHGMNIINKEQDIYGSAKYSPFDSGTTMGGSVTCDDGTDSSDVTEPSESSLGPSFAPQSQKAGDEEKDDGSKLPFGAWWKRGVACLCAHAKETNAIWSVFIAAAVMGLVILGQQWQQERWQVLQQRWQLSLNNEKSGRAFGSLSRFKDIIVGGSRRASYISNSPSADR